MDVLTGIERSWSLAPLPTPLPTPLQKIIILTKIVESIKHRTSLFQGDSIIVWLGPNVKIPTGRETEIGDLTYAEIKVKDAA